MYNILSCTGFREAGGFVASAACAKGRIGIVILFFIIAVMRRWGGEEIGLDFSFIGSLVCGLGGYLILISLTGNIKIAFALGLLFAAVGGYGAGMIFGGGGD